MLIESAVGGTVVTDILENNRPVNVLMRYEESYRNTPDAIKKMLVNIPNGNKVPLSQLADIKVVDGPIQIIRESAKRQIVIQANVDNRDVVSFVNEVQSTIESNIDLPTGYFVTFGGQFENQQRAAKTLAQ